jgi:hypothetical protein
MDVGQVVREGYEWKFIIQVTWVLRLDVSKLGFVCANVCVNFI